MFQHKTIIIREIAVYDQTGRTAAVRANDHSPHRWDLNTASLHSGIYMLKIVTDNGTETAKFVKN